MVLLIVAITVTIAILIIERSRAWWRDNLWRREARREAHVNRGPK